MESEVFLLETSYIENWQQIVKLMRLYASHKNVTFEGSVQISNQDTAWKYKRTAVFAILETL